MYDELMREEFKKNKKSMIGWLLMASWLYYHKPNMEPILGDTTFDKAAKWLYEHFDEVDHKYKSLITKDDLKAGSLYSIGSYDYPLPIIHIAELLSEGKADFIYSS